jgi:pimeloyl-ACP methyl ester carboxylesterase
LTRRWAAVILIFLTSCMAEELPAVEDFSGLVDIGETRLYLECSGSGSPVVVFEVGWGDTSDTWNRVAPAVAEHTRVCSYDRVGLGNSNPGPEPETYLDAVEDLHRLLASAEVPGPYLLVGHSLGGMYVRLYQAQYPDEVAGLVLVDSSHPDSFERSLAVLPPETEGENEMISNYRDWFSSVSQDPTMSPNLLEAGSLGDLPLAVLTGMKKVREGLPEDLNDRFNQIWLDLQTELALMSTNSTHLVLEQSGHFIQQDQPEKVVEVILDLLDEVDS